MTSERPLPPWGLRARSLFLRVFGPLLGLCLGLNALASSGVPVAAVLPAGVAVPVVLVITAGFVVTGALWLAGEAGEGLRGRPD